MKPAGISLLIGTAFGFILSWSQVTNPEVIRRMLLLKEPDVFLLMGSSIAVAAIGVRLLRASGARAFITGEPISWTTERPTARHFIGSALFGAGWSVTGSCPAPVAAMLGEGRLGGGAVALGLLVGIALQGATVLRISRAPRDRTSRPRAV